MIPHVAMREAARRIHAVAIERAFGQPGVDSFFHILETLWELYKHIELSRVEGMIVVFCPVGTTTGFATPSSGQACTDFSQLTNQVQTGLILEIRVDGSCFVHAPNGVDVEKVKHTAVVYQYFAKQELFLAGDERSTVIGFDPSSESQFAVSTFFTLKEALQAYAVGQIRHSSCPIFSQAWADADRIFFKPGPEEKMRQSLTHFLKVRLGASYEVRPEQVMDESHEVDIKVTFALAKRLMVIEIKWLGDSREGVGQKCLKHRDARANEGSQQIADYLDQNLRQAPTHITQGYYVIIDARRRGLSPTTTAITREAGFFYENAEIVFSPSHHTMRKDLEVPFRMFVEPICRN